MRTFSKPKDSLLIFASELNQYADEAEMLSHCAPIFFLPSIDCHPTEIFANGTAGLVYTGTKRLLVTCAHVISEFRNYRTKEPNAVLATFFQNGMGWPTFIDIDTLIDEGEGLLDLATFPASPEWDIHFKQFYRLDLAPSPSVKVLDLIAGIGFPGMHRRSSPSHCAFHYLAFGTSVTNTSMCTFFLSDDLKYFDEKGKSVESVDKGGLSGSPVYLKSRNVLSLCGFLSGEISHGIQIVRASFLEPSGQLRR